MTDWPEYMRPATVARYLDMHRSTVGRWPQNPHLFPPSIVSETGMRWYKKSELDAWMHEHREKRRSA